MDGPYSSGGVNRLEPMPVPSVIAPPTNLSSFNFMGCSTCVGSATGSAGKMPNATLSPGQPANTSAGGLTAAKTNGATPCSGCGRFAWWQIALMVLGAYAVVRKIAG